MSKLLKKCFDELRGMNFPEPGESDELADWIGELAEFDGYIAGLATTALAGSAIKDIPKDEVENMKLRLVSIKDIPDEDMSVRSECVSYLDVLERLIAAL